MMARVREHYDKQAKERQKRKPADSVVENLPQQKARDAAGKAFGVSGKVKPASEIVLGPSEKRTGTGHTEEPQYGVAFLSSPSRRRG